MNAPRAILLLLLLPAGCVERILTIQSDPPGALVYVNQQEVGRTPLQKNFTWYGNYDVTLRKDGYETLKTGGAVNPPVWQWPGIDLVFDVLPFRFRDEHKLQYSLKPSQPVNPAEVFSHAEQMRGQLESSEIKPATRPTR